MSFLTRVFGDPNEKFLKTLEPLVEKINELEKQLGALPDEHLKQKTEEFKKKLQEGKIIDDILPEAFACVREAAKRVLKQRPYDVQILGGIVLHKGQIAEMRTGEGKTLVATLPLYLNALEGKGAHLITVNDYLARIGAGWMGPVYHFLGLTTGVITHDQAFLYDPEYIDNNAFDERLKHFRPVARREAYYADITYGTNNEYGFDYLRDNLAASLERMVQRDLNYAIIDEVDSILIDEARTPLIISAPAEEAAEQYYRFAQLVRQLEKGPSASLGVGTAASFRRANQNQQEKQGDYNIDEKMRAATLTEQGISKMEKWLGVDNIYTSGGIRTIQHIENALKAETLFKKDKDYVVKEGEVIIVDEFTGRLMPGRRYSEGLHQAIEAKEGVKIQRESRTVATITFQNYFRLYKKLSGMTGTALTEAEEFAKIYNLDVTVIPTHKPMIRKDLTDSIYKNEEAKFKAIVKEIKKRQESGQPLLVGTISIEKNEYLSQLLEREGVPHALLNAKNHEKEAQIITQAGKLGAVTIATNMAGRGVDIILGGNPPDSEEQKKVLELGGLHVIGTERHESRRIDNQLRGRAGRQGDPGSSQFFISLDDDLMRIFGGDRLKNLMERLRVPEDMPIENGIVSKSIESAQKKVEGYHFDTRKHLVEYDDVINKHREVIYRKRRALLEAGREDGRWKMEDGRKTAIPNYQKIEKSATIKAQILDMVEAEIEQVVSFHTADDDEKKWDLREIYEVANTIFPVHHDLRIKMEDIQRQAGDRQADAAAREKIINYLTDLAKRNYEAMEAKIDGLAKTQGYKADDSSKSPLRQIEKSVMLRAIDSLWMDHLDAIDHLRTGIGLRGYGQRDPLIEYKKEAFRLFNELLNLIQRQVVYTIYKFGAAVEIGGGQAQATDNSPKALQFSAPKKTMDSGGSSLQRAAQQIMRQRGGQPKQQEQKGDVIVKPAARDESGKKVGRNDPCPCGSGKKYKKCHGQ